MSQMLIVGKVQRVLMITIWMRASPENLSGQENFNHNGIKKNVENSGRNRIRTASSLLTNHYTFLTFRNPVQGKS